MWLSVEVTIKNDQVTRDSTDLEIFNILAEAIEEPLKKFPWVLDVMIIRDNG